MSPLPSSEMNTNTMDDSLFGKLSGELRNRIYELSLREGNEETETVNLEQGWFDCPFHRSKVMHSSRTSYMFPLEPLRVTGLPFTCKQIRRESLRLYYAINHSSFETEYLKSKHKGRVIERLQEWVQRIGLEQTREIRNVTLSLASVKGQHVPLFIDWHHIHMIRSFFHPDACIRIRFYLEGNGGQVRARLARVDAGAAGSHGGCLVRHLAEGQTIQRVGVATCRGAV